MYVRPRSCWLTREMVSFNLITWCYGRNWDITDMTIKAIFQTEIPPSLLRGQNVKIVLLKLSKHHLLSPCVAHVKSHLSNEEQLDGFSEFTACWYVPLLYELWGGWWWLQYTIRPGTLGEVALNRLCSRSCQHMRDDWIQQFIQPGYHIQIHLCFWWCRMAGISIKFLPELILFHSLING